MKLIEWLIQEDQRLRKCQEIDAIDASMPAK